MISFLINTPKINEEVLLKVKTSGLIDGTAVEESFPDGDKLLLSFCDFK
ncbi:hypothetical protein [Chryseobacterium lactis]|nr:hypothetical protein [Chryseobacterium lactis]